MLVHAPQLARHVVEAGDEAPHFLRGEALADGRAQASLFQLAERRVHAAQRPQHEHSGHHQDDQADEHGDQQEVRHVSDDVAAHGRLLLIEGDHDADCPADRLERPTFLRVVGDVELADRLAVAFEAAVVHFERLQVAEPILAVERGHAVVLGHRTIGVERLERLRLELVGNILLAARVEVRVPDVVVAARREQPADALAHHRAVQALELVAAAGRIVDDALGVVHELPHRVHLARERARFLQHGLLGLPLLRVQIERDEREKRHGEHRRQSGKIDGLQTESMLPHERPLRCVRKNSQRASTVA